MSNRIEEYNEKGQSLLRLNEDEKAMEWFDKALEIDQNNATALEKKGLCLLHLEQYDEAIKYYKKLLELNPGHSTAWYKKACAESLKNEPNEALKSLKKAIELDDKKYRNFAKYDPNFSNINNLKEFKDLVNPQAQGLITEILGEFERFKKFLDKVSPQKKKGSNFTFGVSEVKRDNEKVLGQEISDIPNKVEEYNKKGQSFLRLNNDKKAMEWFDKALEIDQNNAIALNKKGLCLLHLKQYDEAIKWYNKTLELNPNDSDAWYNKACAESLKNEPNEALKSLKNAIECGDEIRYKNSAKKDSDFNNIKNLKEFENLLITPVAYKKATPEQVQVLKEFEKIIGKAIPHRKKDSKFSSGISGVKTDGENVVGLCISEIYPKVTTLPESIGNLTSLKELFLGQNQLTILPKSIENLKLLKDLNLGYNQFTTLPEPITKLEWLQKLSFNNNQLTTLPESIGNLKSLQELNLMSNKLNTIPESIGNLKSLKDLNFRDNQLMTLPESIGDLTSLKIVNLGGNKLTTLPESITKFKSIHLLDLGFNHLSVLPEWIANLSSLTSLILENNKLSSLPESFSQLHSIKYVDLKENNWKGEWKEVSKSDIPTILKLCRKLNGIFVFISHAMKDEKTYRILELSKFLDEKVIIQEKGMDMNVIHDSIICEEDLVDDIWEFMTENVPKCHLLVFIATENSIVSEACQYELFLANKYDIEILPIKGTDISWKHLSQIELIDRNKDFQGVLDLSASKEKLEINENNFDEVCEKLSNYIKTHETELKREKKEKGAFEETKKNIINYIYSLGFKASMKENLKEFYRIFQELNNDQITRMDYCLKLGEILSKRKEN
ncbi:MAG: tetratricopeptide repeat protein [Promethearchaeota archaeon]